MIVYHVCGIHKLMRYKTAGCIRPPVRGWIDIKEAERFSKQTGRPIILRLRFDDSDVKILPGHGGMARYIENRYDVTKILGK